MSVPNLTVARLRFEERDAMSEKNIENRLRRRARAQDLLLVKARSRTPEHPEFGTYMLIDPGTNTIVAGGHDGKGFGIHLWLSMADWS
jgi:hypothetical protein